jgi:hypothetical protein
MRCVRSWHAFATAVAMACCCGRYSNCDDFGQQPARAEGEIDLPLKLEGKSSRGAIMEPFHDTAVPAWVTDQSRKKPIFLVALAGHLRVYFPARLAHVPFTEHPME